ncbi:tRNA (adenosine(37)-N6)-threonylcarbamoyltransferase complex dimerization subunit type 1 TsaB [Zoogloea sp.]|uniref:tRNA (adenosine(37)-N6)-threonylcarbamoyltransferase complex dimerization subunit type 1 TsaB n=1 Tax=Zoogloea sp. TaxID=49181 RepID=UPI0026385A85|nr:tRNA (adenosine(37)-N6)-threonylcarbamoyltransferase complex dimerization subunit type 1 TsaB [Zoogloea sp.]MDD3354892.1 tRNA (adenosine(37)-N6)-threonylcarbamoyltransferase complex dimerization subunit type 1 TsaB [Zoogloea sp.]
MKILALETSTDAGSVALLDGERVVERAVVGRPGHSETLLPGIRALLEECSVSLQALDAIAFGAGPGAFTGLRLACGAAQGLALGLGKSVIPVGTLHALAAQCLAESIFVAVDARMSEVYFAAYRRQGGRLLEVQAPACAAPDQVRLPAEGHWFGCGSAFRVYRDTLLPVLAPRLDGLDEMPVPMAASVARLAGEAFLRGEMLDPALAAPLYVRDKVALTTAERLATGGKA